LLGFGCGTHRVRRSVEDDEEGIALRVDLDAPVTLESTPQQLPMGLQEGRETIARLEQKACAALDIGEQDRHCALGQLAHHVRLTTTSPIPCIGIP
jgi:hypothetical protein